MKLKYLHFFQNGLLTNQLLHTYKYTYASLDLELPYNSTALTVCHPHSLYKESKYAVGHNDHLFICKVGGHCHFHNRYHNLLSGNTLVLTLWFKFWFDS